MRKFSGIALGLAVALIGSAAFAADHSGDSNWIHDSESGCWIYNANPQPGEAMAWEGPNCPYGDEANGVGKVTWFQYNQWTSVETGQMVGGIMQGPWTRRYYAGDTTHDYFVDGQLQQPQQDYADQGDDSSGSSDTYTPTYDGDAYMETLKRQNRENCERAAQGYDIPCHPE